MERLGRDLAPGVVVASVGPVTTDRARALGLRVDVTATEYKTEGLLRAIEEHFARRP